MARQVTELQFSFYDVNKYILDDADGVSLASINRSFLYLFNNDVLLYSRINGQFKGLWWKSWYDGKFPTGYSRGDIVTVNGIPELSFLQLNWTSIKRMGDKISPDDKLPKFNKFDGDNVSRYSQVLSELFYLGNKAQQQQLYLSLVDDNKDNPLNTLSWQPYIVTDEELSKKVYLLEKVFRDAISTHEENYHLGLDLLDEADIEYEFNPSENVSIYKDLIKQYIPKEEIDDTECKAWVEFVNNSKNTHLLGLGNVSHNALHIVKPLGDDDHWLESWVRTDGYVKIRGHVQLAMLDEIIPEKGTIDYNEWKNGGMRQYSLQIDFPINNSISKFFYKNKDIEPISTDDETLGQSFFIRSGIDSVQPRSGIDIGQITDVLNKVNQLKNDVSKVANAALFPNSDDYWCPSKDMVVESGSILPSKLQAEYLSANVVPFMINLPKLKKDYTGTRPTTNPINDYKDHPDYIIDPVYSQDSEIAPLVSPTAMVAHINTTTGAQDNSSWWTNWQLMSDMSYFDDDLNKPVRVINFRLLVTKDSFVKLFHHGNSNVKALRSVTANKTLGELMDGCEPDKKEFSIGTIELVNDEITIQNQDITYDDLVDTTETIHNVGKINTQVPGKVTKKGNVVIKYQRFNSVEGCVRLAEEPHDSKTISGLIDSLNLSVQSTMGDDSSNLNKIYSILSNQPGNVIILFYPKNCINKDTNEPIAFRDLALMTDAQRQAVLPEKSYETIDKDETSKNYIGIIENLFKSDDYRYRESSDGRDITTYIFYKVSSRSTHTDAGDIDDGSNSPIDTPTDDLSITASNLRLIRMFGTTRSPALQKVLSMRVEPVMNDLVSPRYQHCKIKINPWNFVYGQKALFIVPTTVSEIFFDIDGVARLDEVEGRNATLYGPMDNIDETTSKSNISIWIDLLVDYLQAVSILRCAKDFGYDIEDQEKLINNIKSFVSKLVKVLLSYRFFPILQMSRTLDSSNFSDLINSILKKAGEFDGVNTGDPGTLGYVLKYVRECYRIFRKELKIIFLYNGLYEKYTFMADDYNLGNQEALVQRVFLRRMLLENFVSEPSLPDLEVLITTCEGLLKHECALVFGDISNLVKQQDTKYRSIITNLRSDSSEILEAEETTKKIVDDLRRKFATENLEEIRSYVSEVNTLLNEMSVARDTLQSWLTQLNPGETKVIVEQRLKYLNSYHNRHVKTDRDIVRGYFCYINTSKEILYDNEVDDEYASSYTSVGSILRDLAGRLSEEDEWTNEQA